MLLIFFRHFDELPVKNQLLRHKQRLRERETAKNDNSTLHGRLVARSF